MWQALLSLVAESRLDALLDCGALLAGTSNRWAGGRGGQWHAAAAATAAGISPSVRCGHCSRSCCLPAVRRAAADYLLPLLDRARFKGVCYFDEVRREWQMLDLSGRRLPRRMSPLREAEMVTLFDEARCRGADLQLRADAIGLLTLVRCGGR